MQLWRLHNNLRTMRQHEGDYSVEKSSLEEVKTSSPAKKKNQRKKPKEFQYRKIELLVREKVTIGKII